MLNGVATGHEATSTAAYPVWTLEKRLSERQDSWAGGQGAHTASNQDIVGPECLIVIYPLGHGAMIVRMGSGVSYRSGGNITWR